MFGPADSRVVCLRKTCLLSAKLGEGSYGMGWRKGATYACYSTSDCVLCLCQIGGWGGGVVCQDMGMERYGEVESTVEMIRL